MKRENFKSMGAHATVRGLLQRPLVLASASPRRRELLRRAGFRFRVVASAVKEPPPRPRESRAHYAIRLASEKAEAVIPRVPMDAIIIAADTIVCADGEVLGKPQSAREARRMLRHLSGKTHRVITGVVLLDCLEPHRTTFAESTKVTFCRLGKEAIDHYVNSGEPFDKAGGYAIQGEAGKFISRIQGCYFNVMGLPIARLQQEMKRFIRAPQ